MDVRRAVELVKTLPILGLINDIVEVTTADPDPNNILVISNNTLFLINFLYFFLYYS